MDKYLFAAMEANPSPMILVQDDRIAHQNRNAALLFGWKEGDFASVRIPDHILSAEGESFISTIVINGESFSAFAERRDGSLFISFSPDDSRESIPVVLSDNLMSSMLSGLFNIGLVKDRLEEHVTFSEKGELYLRLLNRNYFSLRHDLENLRTAMALSCGDLPYSFTALELCSLCSELVSTTALLCSHRGLNIEFSTRLDKLYAYADEAKLEKILLNLLSNAIMHTPGGGQISVGLEKSGDSAYISVDDTGCGIPPELMPKLFRAYERRLSLSEMPDAGGGLGLGIVRGLAEGHGGAVIVESRVGKGTSVRVKIPLNVHRLTYFESPATFKLGGGMFSILSDLAPVLSDESYKQKYRD